MPVPSGRDPDELRRRLALWLATKLPVDEEPTIGEISTPDTTGYSSETLIFDASWTEGGEPRTEGLVARMSPEMDRFPVFRAYDLELQWRAIQIVGELTEVPVPPTRWLETDDGPLGASFFVMDKVDGQVPPDVPPYTMGGWLVDAGAAERERFERGVVGVIAGVHSIDAGGPNLSFLELPVSGDTALRRHVNDQLDYYEWCKPESGPVPLIEQTFEWLEAHWPSDEGPAVMSWGDSRVGNIMWRDFEPVAVFDWEMAGVAPREMDLAWMLFLHQFFQGLTERYDMPGLPDLMERDRMVGFYEELTGHRVYDLEFYDVYAALRFAIISLRTSGRGAAEGDLPPAEDPADLIMFRPELEAMLDGTYWDD